MTSGVHERVRVWLEEGIGLNAASLGEGWLRDWIGRRVAELGLDGEEAYGEYFERSTEERGRVLRAGLVPESWFFREASAFGFLREELERMRRGGRVWRVRPLRVLSIPCACGEEPYSVAVTLLDAGLGEGDFVIEAADVSEEVLEVAREGRYRGPALRGEVPGWFWAYAERNGDGFQMVERVRRLVRFHADNALVALEVGRLARFEVIFCRNLLVYLTPQARDCVVRTICALAEPGAILFLGHADLHVWQGYGLRKVGPSGAFAYRLGQEEQTMVAGGVLRPRPRRSPLAPRMLAGRGRLSMTSKRKKGGAEGEGKGQWTLEEVERRANAGEVREAIGGAEELVKQEPLNGRAWGLLGSLHGSVGESHYAESAFRKALYLLPDDADILLHLALLAEEAGRIEESARYRRRLNRLRGGGVE